MIAKISRGSDTAGLLRYLLGPGRANEHTDPHVVASWDGDPTALEPGVVNGRPQVRALAALLDQPLDALQRRPANTVWHCSLRNAPADRRLSDREWAEAARRVVDRVGLAPVGDADGCRWVAARHGEDHIHLVVTLARQDGRPARTPNDYRRTGQACQELESHFGLTPTRIRDSSAVRRPTRPEVEKAHRAGRQESTRETLRREVRVASIAAFEPRAFLDELRRSGLLVKIRYSTQHSGRPTGYAVAWPGDHARGGKPVWYSGGTLAPDLSLPRLQQRWDVVRGEAQRLGGPPSGKSHHSADWAFIIDALTTVTLAPGPTGDAVRLAHAAASAAIAGARVLEGHRGGVLTRASSRVMDGLDRPIGGSWSESPGERSLLAAARLALLASRSGRRPGTEARRLEEALVNLLRELTQVSAAQSRRRGLTAAAWPDPRPRVAELGRTVSDASAVTTDVVHGERAGRSWSSSNPVHPRHDAPPRGR